MKKLALILFSALVLGGCNPKDLFFKAPAGLEISTSPAATVFLNGDNKGETPFSDKALKPGVYTLKLVPGDTSLAPYETTFTLTSRASTVISRIFAASEIDTTGYTLELQEDASGGTYLSVISDPDTVNVTIDGKPSGFTPLSKLGTTPGAHSLVVTSPGFLEQQLSVNTVKGYNLIVNFKLASDTIILTPSVPTTPSATLTSASPTPNPSPSLATSSAGTMPKPYVIVNDTPDTRGSSGLNVRKDASSSSDPLGKAKIGEKLKYGGETTPAGWHKVEFEGNIGWVSGKYVTVVK